MNNEFQPLGTLIHGIAASEHLDSSGERISIKGLDISSLSRDGVFNHEHKNDVPAQIVGKVLKAKKIFDEKDCETAEELYFWKKSQAPYVYVMGELFDGVGHKGAQEIAAMLKYDALSKKQNRPGMNVVNFSIEGSKLNKEGQEITRSLARKVTITVAACNKVAVAEMLSPSSKKEESILDFAKSEESGVEMLEKNAKIFKLPQTTTAAPAPEKKAKVPYPFESKEEMSAWRSKNKMMDRQSAAGLSGKIGASAQKPTAQVSSGPQTMAGSNKLFRPGISKAMTAGSGMSAPANKVSMDALSKEGLMSQVVKSSEYPKFLKFITSKYPEMTKDEADAMAKYMTARQLATAESNLEKMMALDKSKNVREQRKKIFGTDANAPRTSERRQKMMQQIKDFAERRFGMPMEVAQGKRDASGKIRTDKDNQPAYDVFSPEGVEKEKKLLAQYKKKGVKRTDPKPDWRSGRLETQPSPDAAVHEMAHLYLSPEGMTPAMFQEEMDRLWGESQSKYGHMQQKKTSGEIQPMSVENPIRREMGLPANRATKPVKQQERALDYEGDRFVEGKDSKGKKVFYDRQSRLMTPETKERVEQVREGSLKFHPDHGWFKETSPDTLVNLRGRGKTDEAKARAQERYASTTGKKKLAASEHEKGVHMPLSDDPKGGQSRMGAANRKISEYKKKGAQLRQLIPFVSALKEHGKVMTDQKNMSKPNLPKSELGRGSMYKRCWEGYRPVPGKKPYSEGSCEKE